MENAALPFPQVLPTALSATECAAIVALGETRVKRAAGVDGRSDLASRDYRVSEIAWIEPDADAHRLYHRLGVMFLQINPSYGFELTGFAEGLQYASYGPGQYFGWHADIGPDSTSLRKLSLTIQLSDPAEYDGGALQFHGAADMPAARAWQRDVFPVLSRASSHTGDARCAPLAGSVGLRTGLQVANCEQKENGEQNQLRSNPRMNAISFYPAPASSSCRCRATTRPRP